MKKDILKKLKPAAPKPFLIAAGALLWGFAAYRILSMGLRLIQADSIENQWKEYGIGILGFIPFFLLVFRKVSRKYITRIKNLPNERPCIFAFFDRKGYIIMTFMITMGILMAHWDIIPPAYKGTFFISLGLSLLASAIFYVIEGYNFTKTRYCQK